mmetsp:Transcript_75/g.147  ORF Transcript_75/g.147 Transcript_75/m.147 type:complete len:184 (+) Transcript_75:354-905(+)
MTLARVSRRESSRHEGQVHNFTVLHVDGGHVSGAIGFTLSLDRAFQLTPLAHTNTSSFDSLRHMSNLEVWPGYDDFLQLTSTIDASSRASRRGSPYAKVCILVRELQGTHAGDIMVLRVNDNLSVSGHNCVGANNSPVSPMQPWGSGAVTVSGDDMTYREKTVFFTLFDAWHIAKDLRERLDR